MTFGNIMHIQIISIENFEAGINQSFKVIYSYVSNSSGYG